MNPSPSRHRLHRLLEILTVLLKTDTKVRYGGTLLGFLWAFLHPFALFLVLLTVFRTLGGATPHYALRLLLGVILFHFFAEATNAGVRSLHAKASLLLRLPISPILVIMSSTLNAFLHLLFSLSIFALFLVGSGILPSVWGLTSFAFLLLLLLLLALSCNFVLALLSLPVRDLENIWDLTLHVLFFLTPIFYPLDILPFSLHPVILANPLTVIVEGGRTVLLSGSVPPLVPIALLTLALAILLPTTACIARRLFPSLVELL